MVAQTSSTVNTPSEDDIKVIDELMSAGKRNLICKEPQQAVDCFAELCEKLAQFYGQTADECVEAYLYYGKALLEVGRVESGVLGHAIKEAPEIIETEDEDEVDEKEEKDDIITEDEEEMTSEKELDMKVEVQHAMRGGNLYNGASTEEEEDTEDETEAQGEAEEQKSEETPSTSSDATKTEESKTEQVSSSSEKDQAPSSSTKSESSTSDVQTTSEEPGSSKTEGEAIADDEDLETGEVTNMQLAWEMFELTVFLCKRMIKKKHKDADAATYRLAEAKYGLGQISLETEFYSEAIADFSECLKHYQTTLEENDRCIAEVYYNIGLSYSFEKSFDKAIENYKQAIGILEARIKSLEKKAKTLEGGKEKPVNELDEINKEIRELKDLIVLDMQMKVDDAQEMKKQADASLEYIKETTKEMFAGVGTSNAFDKGFDDGFDESDNTKPVEVTDISSKVRHSSKSSKRKSDDDETPAETKKLKKIETNGNTDTAKTNGHTVEKENDINGHSNVIRMES